MFGQSFFSVSQYVASSFNAAFEAPPAAEDEAPPDEAAPPDEEAPPEAGAAAEDDALPDEGAPAAAEVAAALEDEDPVLEPAVDGVLLLLQDETSSATALMPAMVVAIALLADVRDTRPTSVSWGEKHVRVLTTAAMKAFSTPVCKLPRTSARNDCVTHVVE
jgi:hypothetical protein